MSEFKSLNVKTPGQKEFVRNLVEHEIIALDGIFGTGKTYVTIGIACGWLINKGCKIDKIVISRPLVGCDNDIGALPGELNDRIKPYFAQQAQYFYEFLGRETFAKAINSGQIEMVPTELLRSRSYNDTLVILDEAQNCTKRQIMLTVSRIGKGSKLVMVGDYRQSDIGEDSFFKRIIMSKEKFKHLVVCELTEADFFRNFNALACYKELNTI